MAIIILTIVIGLVAWALRLMQQAIDQREFSLMLAGTLVAFSAAAMVGVYSLMGDCMGYLANASQYPTSNLSSSDPTAWVIQLNSSDFSEVYPAIKRL